MNKVKIGAITIGQSPRVDVTPDIKAVLGERFILIERGALDAFSYDYVCEQLSPQAGDTVLVSRMRDGRQVVLAEEKIMGLLQNCISDLEAQGCEAIVMLCTGKFPQFEHQTLLIKPQMLLQTMTKGLAGDRLVGVLVPNAAQIERVTSWWQNYGVQVTLVAASPYQDIQGICKAAEELKKRNPDVIFMDCMGYSVAMKEKVRAICQKPVLLPRTVIARIIKELYA